jgi:nucleotide-binding universal stress UspA family protein
LNRLRLWLERAGASEVDTELVQGGDAEDEIVNIAQSKECSLILMGTQGKGITREILLGSVAHQVARQAEQPVLFIPMLQ